MKDVKDDIELSTEVEKSIGEAVDADIEKVIQEAGEIEKSAPKLFGIPLGKIVKIRKKGD